MRARRDSGLILVATLVPVAAISLHAQVSQGKALICEGCDCSRTTGEMKVTDGSSDIAGCVYSRFGKLTGVRVRMVPAHSDSSFGKSVSPSGHFAFMNVPNGQYVLVILKDEKTIGVNVVTVPSSFPITFEVSDHKANMGPRIVY
jgi:hypothetical protein